MKGFKRARIFKEKGVVIALVLCLVSVAAIAGVYVVENNRQKEQSLVKLDEVDKDEASEPTEETAADRIVNEEKETEENEEDGGAAEDAQETAVEKTGSDDGGTAETKEQATVQTAAAPVFKEDDKLSWPVKGNVILDYSMDKTVYFSTLDQYKYNPGLLIAGDVNTKVTAAAAGTVKSIEVNEETGNTLTMDLGGGFTAVYGQLKEVPVTEGTALKAGQTIGYISEPTKYYVVEGSNLYFQLLKDDEPVDPMDYLE